MDCRAAVGCHSGTDVPFGYMADPMTRRARQNAHKHFDAIWKGPRRSMGRTNAYIWIANKLGIPREDCHISRFDYGRCTEMVSIILECQKELDVIRKGHKSRC